MEFIQERTVRQATQRVADANRRAGEYFGRLFTDAADRALHPLADGTIFVETGDIPAMWLRDSTTQMLPYLHFVAEDTRLADTLAAVSRRQLGYIIHDPYANAFNEQDNGHGHQSDIGHGDGWVWERKYEVDSLCYPVQLAFQLWRLTGRTDHLVDFPAAAKRILEVLSTEQEHESRSTYLFQRLDGPASDTLARNGRGGRTRPTGLTWSAFRPSDDACSLGFNIPGNAFAVVALTEIEQIMHEVHGEDETAGSAAVLAREIDSALRTHAAPTLDGTDTCLAYEVDGMGGHLRADDANVPSLLSLPMLGWCTTDDPLYLRTRSFILSDENPYHYSGTAATGIGSPHTPPDHIWPIALAVQGLTTPDTAEKAHLLETLMDTDGGTGFMHESFHKDDPTVFTRPWFSWANAMFCELALDLVGSAPVSMSTSGSGTGR